MATVPQNIGKINMNFKLLLKSFRKSYVYIWFLALLLPPFLAPTEALSKPKSRAFDSSIVIYAPTSMSHAMHEIMKLFANKYNISVSATYESAGELAISIEEGESANIFITEDSIKMRDLQRMGVLNVFSLTDIAADELVIAAPKNSYVIKKLNNIASTDDKMRFLAKNVSLAVPDPEFDAAGKFAKQAFNKIGEWEKVEARMLKATNTDNSLYLAANGDSPGVLYRSDALKNDNVEIIFAFPKDYTDKIIYQASVVAGLDSEDINKASEKFIKFLKTDIIKSIFVKYGFGNI